MAKWFIIIGIVCILLGVAWPLLAKLGLGRLPGDIHVQKEGFNFYFPIATSIILSLVLSLLFWIFRR